VRPGLPYGTHDVPGPITRPGDLRASTRSPEAELPATNRGGEPQLPHVFGVNALGPDPFPRVGGLPGVSRTSEFLEGEAARFLPSAANHR
jgi:hypothetical protein